MMQAIVVGEVILRRFDECCRFVFQGCVRTLCFFILVNFKGSKDVWGRCLFESASRMKREFSLLTRLA